MEDVSKRLKFKVKYFAKAAKKSYDCILSVGIISSPFLTFSFRLGNITLFRPAL